MKKSISVVLASVLAFSLFSVTAFADDPTLHVQYPESGEVNVTVPKATEPPSDNLVYDTYTVEPSESLDSPAKDISVKTDSSVSVWYTGSEEGSNFTGFNFYLPNDDPDCPWVEWEEDDKPTEDGGKWYFTMPDEDVFVEAVFELPTPMPSSEAIPIPQSNPEPSQPTPGEEPQSAVAGTVAPTPIEGPQSAVAGTVAPTPVEEPQSAVAGTVAPTPVEEPQSTVAGTVAPTPMKSVLPAGTVSFSGGATIGTNINDLNGLTKNSAEKFSATVLNLEARDLSNQNELAKYYAAVEGKEANILATYGVYASKNLSAEDNGKLTTLTWKNITAEKLDKNTKIKAVCYNLIDGTYTIEGEIDVFGNIIFKNFILRPTKTNITVFVC